MKKFYLNLLRFALVTTALLSTACGKEDSLFVYPDGLEFTADPSREQIVTVTTNAKWKAITTATWLTISEEIDRFYVLAEKNNTSGERNGIIIVTAGNADPVMVDVIQQPGVSPNPDPDPDLNEYYLTASPSQLDFPNSAGSKQLQITSDISWTISSDQAWCSLSSSQGSGNASVNVTVTANSLSESRKAQLTLSDTRSMISKAITVIQFGIDPSIIISPASMDTGADAKTVDVNVSANVAFDVTSNVSWITVSQATAVAVSLKVLANNDSNSRTGTVTFKQKNGAATTSMTINQAGVDTFDNLYDIFVTWRTTSGSVVYWKNGSMVTLNANAVGFPFGIWVTNNHDVYVVGSLLGYSAVYFKNDVLVIISKSNTDVYSITVEANDIYIAGVDDTYNYGYAAYWKNGIKTRLSSKNSEARKILKNGNDLYIAGNEKGSGAVYWKNGKMTSLINGEDVSDMVIAGGDVYITGYTGTTGKYWKNEKEIILGEGMIPDAIAVEGNDVYVSCADKLLKNGVEQPLPVDCKKISSIFVIDNNLFVAGLDDFGGVSYWNSNGKRVSLPFSAGLPSVGNYAPKIYVMRK